jgi:hypothetical protein
MADGADAVSLRFCNAIGGAVVSGGAGVALADRRNRFINPGSLDLITVASEVDLV